MREVTVTATQGAAELLTCAFDMVAKAVSRAARSAPEDVRTKMADDVDALMKLVIRIVSPFEEDSDVIHQWAARWVIACRMYQTRERVERELARMEVDRLRARFGKQDGGRG